MATEASLSPPHRDTRLRVGPLTVRDRTVPEAQRDSLASSRWHCVSGGSAERSLPPHNHSALLGDGSSSPTHMTTYRDACVPGLVMTKHSGLSSLTSIIIDADAMPSGRATAHW